MSDLNGIANKWLELKKIESYTDIKGWLDLCFSSMFATTQNIHRAEHLEPTPLMLILIKM